MFELFVSLVANTTASSAARHAPGTGVAPLSRNARIESIAPVFTILDASIAATYQSYVLSVEFSSPRNRTCLLSGDQTGYRALAKRGAIWIADPPEAGTMKTLPVAPGGPRATT